MIATTRRTRISATAGGCAVAVTLGLVTVPPVDHGLAFAQRVEVVAVQLQAHAVSTAQNMTGEVATALKVVANAAASPTASATAGDGLPALLLNAIEGLSTVLTSAVLFVATIVLAPILLVTFPIWGPTASQVFDNWLASLGIFRSPQPAASAASTTPGLARRVAAAATSTPSSDAIGVTRPQAVAALKPADSRRPGTARRAARVGTAEAASSARKDADVVAASTAADSSSPVSKSANATTAHPERPAAARAARAVRSR
jgi:hypothetical protein